MKNLGINNEQIGIPETAYQAIEHMPSRGFACICKLDCIGIRNAFKQEIETEDVNFVSWFDECFLLCMVKYW